jgi:hypothetical protein
MFVFIELKFCDFISRILTVPGTEGNLIFLQRKLHLGKYHSYENVGNIPTTYSS